MPDQATLLVFERSIQQQTKCGCNVEQSISSITLAKNAQTLQTPGPHTADPLWADGQGHSAHSGMRRAKPSGSAFRGRDAERRLFCPQMNAD